LGFINPLLLFGLIAAFIPFLIHLWNKRQAKVVDFSSLRFLLVAHRKRVRRLQIKQWLILILRMLIIVLIVLALARPLLKNRFSFAGTRSKTSCVIILDNSYSMGYNGIKGQRFEIAKQRAQEVLDSLEKGDSASLILMSDIAEPVFKKLTKDLTLVRSAIKNSKLSNRTTFVPPSIELALSILEDSKEPNKEIYLITDFDGNGWEGWTEINFPPNVRLFAIETRLDTNPENIAIKNIQFSNKLLSINTPVSFETEIVNFSNFNLNNIVITLFIDGVKSRTVNIDIPAGDNVIQSFTHQFNSPGTHTGKFVISSDRLTVDDVRYFAVKVYGQIKVLCVGKNSSYLSLALNPEINENAADLSSPISGLVSEYVFLPVICKPEELENMPFEEFDIVIISDIDGISSSILKRLRNLVTNGKELILFVSEGYNEGYNEIDLFPARLGELLTFENPIKIGFFEQEHPIFRNIFNTQHFSGENAPLFYKAYRLEKSENVEIIARFNNNIPAILERDIGRGKVFLFNTYVSDLSWSNFVLKPIFLPLLHQTSIYAISEEENSIDEINLQVGTTFSGYYEDYASNFATIKNISMNSESKSSNSSVVVGNNGVLKYELIQFPGIYEIEIKGKDRIKRDFFAVSVDTSESNLSYQEKDKSLAKLNTAVNSIETSSYNDQGKLKKTLNSYRMGKEISNMLLIIAIVLMFFEIFLANREK